jgi:hypothetical protein
MKKILLYSSILLTMMALSLSSCSSEDDLTPSNADENLFGPKSSDNSQLAQLRNSFHEKVGSYLLFNDTLVTKKTGTDVYGQDLWYTETVDLNYFLTSDNGYIYEYSYITDYETQKKAADFITEKLAPKLGAAVPYSFLLVNKITKYTYTNGQKKMVSSWNTPHPTIVLGMRCYAVSIENGSTFDNTSFISTTFSKIIADKVGRLSDSDLASFYSYCNKYYGEYKEDLGFENGYNNDLARSLGFLKDGGRTYFPYESNDLSAYETAICTYSLSAFEQEFAKYPICITKFKFLRSLCESMGFVFD